MISAPNSLLQHTSSLNQLNPSLNLLVHRASNTTSRQIYVPPEPTVPPPPLHTASPPACINQYYPQANRKFQKLISNVGLESSIEVRGSNAGLCYMGGIPFNFLLVRPPPYPHPPNSEMDPPALGCTQFCLNAELMWCDNFGRR